MADAAAGLGHHMFPLHPDNATGQPLWLLAIAVLVFLSLTAIVNWAQTRRSK